MSAEPLRSLAKPLNELKPSALELRSDFNAANALRCCLSEPCSLNRRRKSIPVIFHAGAEAAFANAPADVVARGASGRAESRGAQFSGAGRHGMCPGPRRLR